MCTQGWRRVCYVRLLLWGQTGCHRCLSQTPQSQTSSCSISGILFSFLTALLQQRQQAPLKHSFHSPYVPSSWHNSVKPAGNMCTGCPLPHQLPRHQSLPRAKRWTGSGGKDHPKKEARCFKTYLHGLTISRTGTDAQPTDWKWITDAICSK